MGPLKRLQAGDAPTLSTFNGRAEAIRGGRTSSGTGGSFGVERNRSGTKLRKLRRRTLWGTLSGAGPSYAFTEAIDNGDETWSVGPDSGTAYEVNRVVGLNGQRHLLHPDRVGDYRFQRVATNGGRTPPCTSAVACIAFMPDCPADATEGATVTLTFTPSGGGTGSSFTGPPTPLGDGSGSVGACITHVGSGTVAYTYTGDNFLDKSGSFAVSECGSGGGPTVTLTRNYYLLVCDGFCNYQSSGDPGIAITLTLSGDLSGECDPTLDDVNRMNCKIPVEEPFDYTTLSITGTAARYKVGSTHVGPCSAVVHFVPADGYVCCPPAPCGPMSTSLKVSTPFGDLTGTYDVAAHGSIYPVQISVVKTVLGWPKQPTGTPGVYTTGCGSAYVVKAMVPVTFHIGASCNGVSAGYLGCTIDPDHAPVEDATYATVGTIGGYGCSTGPGTQSCPPGEVFSGSIACGNSYLDGAYSVSEA